MQKKTKRATPITVNPEKSIARAFARGKVCRETADYFGISLGQALDSLGDPDQWRTPTADL